MILARWPAKPRCHFFSIGIRTPTLLRPSHGFWERSVNGSFELGEQGNINHFRDQEAENKFGTNLGKKGTQIYFSINNTLKLTNTAEKNIVNKLRIIMCVAIYIIRSEG